MFEHMPNSQIVDAVLPVSQNLFRAHGLLESFSSNLGTKKQFFLLLAAPVTFLYNTLFVYEKRLREKSNYRQALIIGILGNRTTPKPIDFTCHF